MRSDSLCSSQRRFNTNTYDKNLSPKSQDDAFCQAVQGRRSTIARMESIRRQGYTGSYRDRGGAPSLHNSSMIERTTMSNTSLYNHKRLVVQAPDGTYKYGKYY